MELTFLLSVKNELKKVVTILRRTGYLQYKNQLEKCLDPESQIDQKSHYKIIPKTLVQVAHNMVRKRIFNLL